MPQIKLFEFIQKHQQIFRFLIAGGFAFAVNIVALYVLTDILGVYYIISTVGAFLISFSVSFTLQKFWTFQDASKDNLHIQLPLYLTMQAASVTLNAGLMYIFVEYFHIWHIISQVIISLGLAVVIFFLNKKYIFKAQTAEV